MNEHLFKRFDEELTKLRYRLVRMGTLVQQQIEMAVNALLENNKESANFVIKNEDKVDKLDIKIDKQCMRIFALHQPLAYDLRLVLSSLSLNENLELLGDIAVNIADDVINSKISPQFISKTKIEEMAKQVILLMNKVMDSFVYMNIDFALEAIKITNEIDELYKSNFIIISELLKNSNNNIEPSCFLIDINRNIQFISRQAKSMAEELVFLVDARIIKHLNLKMTEEEGQ